MGEYGRNCSRENAGGAVNPGFGKGVVTSVTDEERIKIGTRDTNTAIGAIQKGIKAY